MRDGSKRHVDDNDDDDGDEADAVNSGDDDDNDDHDDYDGQCDADVSARGAAVRQCLLCEGVAQQQSCRGHRQLQHFTEENAARFRIVAVGSVAEIFQGYYLSVSFSFLRRSYGQRNPVS